MTTCSSEGCGGVVKAKGMCSPCYKRFWRTGSVARGPRSYPHGSVEERFWRHVKRLGPDECWEWRGFRDKDGYGHLHVNGGNPGAIGEEITTERARALAIALGLSNVVAAIDREPEAFKPWVFDGVSVLDDRLAGWLTGLGPAVTEIALRHDLKYAYGRPGFERERMLADIDLLRELVLAGGDLEMAHAFFNAVRQRWVSGRVIKTSFTWGFARR